MEESTAAGTGGPPADPAALPAGDGDVAPEDRAGASHPVVGTEIVDPWSNLDTVVARARAAVEAAAAEPGDPPQDEDGPAEDGPPAAAGAASVPAPAVTTTTTTTTAADDDDEALSETLRARGYTVEPPAPPPDPFSELVTRLAPMVGTADEYAATKARAIQAVPPAPDLYAPDYDQRLAYREQVLADKARAASILAGYDLSRSVADVAVPWARQRILGELGIALGQVPERYGLSPEQASRVTQPTTMTDAIAAVAEAVEAAWTKKLADLETKHTAALARARSDGRVARANRLANAPQVGGRAGAPASPFTGIYGPDGLPTEEAIARAKRGGLRLE